MQLGDKMKIGIIGFGAIGFDVAKKLDKETDQFNVIGVHSRTKNKIDPWKIRFFIAKPWILAIFMGKSMQYSTSVVWLEIFLFGPQKIAIKMLYETIFGFFLAILEEKTHRFFMLQYEWYTLYLKIVS